MGVKTVEELIKEGVRLAGKEYDAEDTRPLSDLIEWLSSVALSWPWSETTFNLGPTLVAGSNLLYVGMGATVGATTRITRVNFPLKILYGPNTLPDNINQEGFNDSFDAAYVPEGIPDKASYSRNWGAPGKVLIVFNKKPRTDLLIHVPVQVDPSIDLTLESTVWYPNDNTIKEAIAYHTARYHDGVDADKTLKFEDSLSVMVKNDKLKFGVIDSFVLKMNRNPRSR